jgi:hypothetical protein
MARYKSKSKKRRRCRGYKPPPRGTYEVRIISAVIKATKKANGAYLELWFEITAGPKAKRRLCERFNIENPNSQTVEWAKQRLTHLYRALGRDDFDDIKDLLGRSLMIKIKRRRRTDGQGFEAVVQGHFPLEPATGTEITK